MAFKTVTVAVDFDAPSHVALAYAAAFCRPMGSAIEVLHVSDADHDRATKQLRAWIETVGVRGAPKILGGRAAETIVDYMTSSDLTVVGTHRRTGLAGFFLGSVAEKVVRAAITPVLVVPNGIDRTVPPVRILVPVDFSDAAAEALELAAAIGDVAKSDIVALHVIETVPVLPVTPTLSPKATPGSPLETYYDIAHRNATASMKNIVADHKRTTFEVRIAHPVDGICAAAEAIGADLIVMGTRGLSGLAHFGSVAERTLRRAPCPVLVIHAASTALPSPE